MKIKRTCEYPGCDRPHNANGYCMGHYRRDRLGMSMEGFGHDNNWIDHPEWGVNRVREIIASNPSITGVEIGRLAGISRQRVSQIRNRYGI